MRNYSVNGNQISKNILFDFSWSGEEGIKNNQLTLVITINTHYLIVLKLWIYNNPVSKENSLISNELECLFHKHLRRDAWVVYTIVSDDKIVVTKIVVFGQGQHLQNCFSNFGRLFERDISKSFFVETYRFHRKSWVKTI